MCEPATITLAIAGATAAMSAAQAVAAHEAAQQQANDSQNAQNSRYKQVSKEALANYKLNINQLGLRSEQESIADAQRLQEASGQVKSIQGSLRAGSSAAGVSGNTVNQLINEFSSLEAGNEAVTKTNASWRQAQMDMEMQSLHAGAQSAINTMTPQQVRGPSGLALGLGLAKSGLDGYNSLYSMSTPQQRSDMGSWFRPTNKG